MKKISVWTAVLALLAGVLAGCGHKGSVSNQYITIKQYNGLEIEAPDQTEITDEDVEQEISSQLQTLSAGQTEVPDRAIKEGDTVVLDAKATDKDGNVPKGTVLNDYELRIGSGKFIPGWEDACIGKKFGKEFTFDLKFPDDYSTEELAGQTVTWTVTVKGLIAGKTAAGLTDDMVKQLSTKSSTVKEYKAEVKKRLKDNLESSNRQILETEVWEALMEQAEVKEYPKDRLEKKINEGIMSYRNLAEQYGMSYEDFLSESGLTEKDLRKEIKKSAKEELKKDLAAELLMDELGIDMSKKDYEKKYEELATLYGYGGDADQFVAAAGEDLAKQLAERSAVSDWLIKHAKQVKKTSGSQDQTEQEDKAMGDSQQ